MKKNENLINYFLSIGLVVLIIIFIMSLAGISRIVLSDNTPIGEHVITTKNLLDDINEVKESTTEKKNETKGSFQNSNFLSINYKGFNITDLAYHNINENKSILTIFLDGEIKNIGGVYYLKIRNFNTLEKGALIAYKEENIIKIGEFVSFEDEMLVIVNEDDKQEITKASKENVEGRVFLMKDD